MRVFATTIIRGDANPELTGFLYELDFQNTSVKSKIPIPIDSSNPFWNARGGNRGGRGIVMHDGILYVGTATSILKYDTHLNQIGSLDHPLFAGLHEMFVDGDGIWVTCTVHDLVMKIGFNGEFIEGWWGSESKRLQEIFGYSGRALNLEMDFGKEHFVEGYEQYCQDERLHINTVLTHGKQVYILSCRKSALIRIKPHSEQIIISDASLMLPHNCIITEHNEIIINNTMRQSLNIYALSDGKLLREIPTNIFGESMSEQFAKAGWQRGLSHLNGSKYLVGTSPATIFEVDIDSGEIGQIMQIDNDVKHCIHGLAVVHNF